MGKEVLDKLPDAFGFGRAGKDAIYQLSQDFMHMFEEKHSTLLCRDLLGIDISSPAGYQAAAENKVFTTICPVLVQDAVEIVEKMLETA